MDGRRYKSPGSNRGPVVRRIIMLIVSFIGFVILVFYCLCSLPSVVFAVCLLAWFAYPLALSLPSLLACLLFWFALFACFDMLCLVDLRGSRG